MTVLTELISNFDINYDKTIIRIILGVGLVGTEMDWVSTKIQ